jgi:hypothetical protein
MQNNNNKRRKIDFLDARISDVYGDQSSSSSNTITSLIQTLNQTQSLDSPEKQAADDKVAEALAQLKRPYAHRNGVSYKQCALCIFKVDKRRKDAVSDIIDEMSSVAKGRACDILSIRSTMKSIYLQMITRSVNEGKMDPIVIEATNNADLLDEVIDHFMFIDDIKIAITDKYNIITALKTRQDTAEILSRLFSAVSQTSDMEQILPIVKTILDGMRLINKNTSSGDL